MFVSRNEDNGERQSGNKRSIAGNGEKPGDLLAGFELIEEIGRGGMGVVWSAMQTEYGLRREVALKIIKAGMDTDEVVSRFEAERQALAMMDHPGIARVFDAGTTDRGRPFFVMERVHGISITDYCDSHELETDRRLQLFVNACQAVQHAHQKGVIHRDIKPSNIIVTDQEGSPTPKVIDFGIAKAIDDKLTENTLTREPGRVIGTLGYMSPEQASGDRDIDTRTDVYSLGVVLYEILTGIQPFPEKMLGSVPFDVAVGIIREKDPPKPSTCLSQVVVEDGNAGTIKKRTAPDIRKLERRFRGDLDWIVMRALEKDRARRYESPIELARDIERHLNHEPVTAAAPSRSYRAGKFVRKHRNAVLAVAAMVVLLVGGTVASLWQAVLKENARAAEEIERKRAETRLAQVQKANEILGSIFENLDPNRAADDGRPLQTILAEQLGHAIEQLEGDATGAPLSVAEVQYTLGCSLVRLGEAAIAIEPLKKALQTRKEELGLSHLDTLLSLNALGGCYINAGSLQLALPVLEQAVELAEEHLGPRHPSTIKFMGNLAVLHQDMAKLDLALPLLKHTFEVNREVLGRDHPDTLESMNSLGLAHNDVGEYTSAIALLEEVLHTRRKQLAPTHPATLRSMNNLAVVSQAAGKLDGARPLLEEAFDLSKSTLGPEHPLTLRSMANLALTYEAENKPELAVPLIEKTTELQRKRLGSKHPETVNALRNLAMLYWSVGDKDAAVPLFEEIAETSKEVFGTDSPATLKSLYQLERTYIMLGSLDRALPVLEEVVLLRDTFPSNKYPEMRRAVQDLGTAYFQKGKFESAEPLLMEALDVPLDQLAEDNPNRPFCLDMLSQIHRKLGQWEQAVHYNSELLRLRKRSLGPTHPDTIASMHSLGTACRANGNLEKAIALLETTVKLREETFGAAHPDTLDGITNLARAHRDAGDLDLAIELSEDAVDRGTTSLGANHQATRWSSSNLGLCYVMAGRFGEAVPLLEDAYQVAGKTAAYQWVGPELLAAYAGTKDSARVNDFAAELVAELRATNPDGGTKLAGGMKRVAMSLVEIGSFSEAEILLRECLVIYQDQRPDTWLPFHTMSVLGEALQGMGHTDEAETMFLEGHSGMQQHDVPPRSRNRPKEALERLVQFYESRGAEGDREKAIEYRQKLAEVEAP